MQLHCIAQNLLLLENLSFSSLAKVAINMIKGTGNFFQSYQFSLPSAIRASRIRNFVTHFFVHLITFLSTPSCTSHFVHLKYSFVHACTQCVPRCAPTTKIEIFQSRGKLKVYFTHHPPRTQSGYADCLLQRKRQQTYFWTYWTIFSSGSQRKRKN